ncbi:AraC family transcriptional regulator [Streptomyces sp. AV19]|uniref:helix-turn-helix domain-containing protein n=1 Tax=Streptomyces sp. AV19 TaxID=2793068 RepID=UPI0018FE2328|nr:helix-turn-helix domain-containing protein [Streptomyces sp. AV19]MBH1938379.1 AraC family transcriptional regulator [Streptomyces sp. AV19]MDG4535028.1 helix-turn-helix domain-containing protein [Streptomyces sp. AV19]
MSLGGNQAAVIDTWMSESAELVYRAPDHRLAGLVLAYTGEDWTFARPLVRRAMALASVVLVINFSPSERRVIADARAPLWLPKASLMSGLTDRPMLVEQAGWAYGMTVQLTPPGARMLLGMPLHELTNRVVELDDFLGADARRLAERLTEAPDWAARFHMLDGYLIARIGAAAELAAPVWHAWRRLTALSGDMRIGTLADEVGWSRQHLNARFHQEIGLPPKTVARITRLQKTLGFMTGTMRPSWADAAVMCGFADQSHLIRDFRMLAGGTPTGLRALMTDWSGLMTGNPLMTTRPLLRRITATAPGTFRH